MKLWKFLIGAFVLLILAISPILYAGSSRLHSAPKENTPVFSWKNASIYFVMLDRFKDGDPTNNYAYNRGIKRDGLPDPAYQKGLATFHGGDLEGLTGKLREGYFQKLGIQALWITCPFEQVHGWVAGDGFRHYGYHGYSPLDFTSIDENFGTREDFETMIDTAHSQGIRILLDTVINHTGNESMADMAQYGYASLKPRWQDYYDNAPENTLTQEGYRQNISYTDRAAWGKWWGTDWVRSDLAEGYDRSIPGSEIFSCCMGLPDLKTESGKMVDLPQILRTKWQIEGRLASETQKLDAWFQATGKKRFPANYLVKWITDWVETCGIDGFRLDTAANVDMSTLKTLNDQAAIALSRWKDNNPRKKPETVIPCANAEDARFYSMGEVYLYNLDKGKNVKNEEGREYYADGHFNSLLNFAFMYEAKDQLSAAALFQKYADKVNSQTDFQIVSTLSNHDLGMYDRNRLKDGASYLMLSPGGISVFYGDETRRLPDPVPPQVSDPILGLRSDMNFDNPDQNLLEHWQKLGSFRARHVSIGAGEHMRIKDPSSGSDLFVFGRVYDQNGIGDRIVAALGLKGMTTLDVGAVFSNGTLVRDCYTGQEATVVNGKVTLDGQKEGVLLLEEKTPGQPRQIKVHFKKPDNWSKPRLYYYWGDYTPAWGNAPQMTPEGDGWYAYTVDGFSSARVIFGDDSGHQNPPSGQEGFLRDREGWFDGVSWK